MIFERAGFMPRIKDPKWWATTGGENLAYAMPAIASPLFSKIPPATPMPSQVGYPGADLEAANRSMQKYL